MLFFFFFNDTATTEIYTLSLHDALPISHPRLFRETEKPAQCHAAGAHHDHFGCMYVQYSPWASDRSEEHTSELQSQSNLVCRLLLEKKKKKYRTDCQWRRRRTCY